LVLQLGVLGSHGLDVLLAVVQLHPKRPHLVIALMTPLQHTSLTPTTQTTYK
jgi:hypothetical protein